MKGPLTLVSLLGLMGSSEACMAHLTARAMSAEELSECPGKYVPPESATAIENARVFNGVVFGNPQTVVMKGGKITSVGANPPQDAEVVDGSGKFLIPGLVDGHVHPPDCTGLAQLAGYGVTTAINMNCADYNTCETLRSQSGVADFVSGSFFAVGAGGQAATFFGVPDEQTIKPDTDLSAIVDYAFGNGSNFFKIVAEENGPSQTQQNELVQLARGYGKFTATHAALLMSYDQAIASGSETIQHTPVDGTLLADQITKILAQEQFVTPTMELYRKIFSDPQLQSLFGFDSYDYSTVETNVRNMHVAGVPILAGTDAVGNFQGIVDFKFGQTLHCELQNLVSAGLSNADAINAATSSPAQYYRVNDRGSIAAGKRADLLLLNSNPLQDIKNTFDVSNVWIGGIEVADVLAIKGETC